ncbi:MAG: sialate O-acetylesterase [Phycisphaeraceae bacterium]
MRSLRVVSCLWLILLTATSGVSADVKLPAVIGSNMVLQRGQPLPIWGTADADEAVTVALGEDNAASTKADAKGNWSVKLKPMQADGKSYTLTIKGRNTIELKDILIGEVWICSGQSNMEWSVGASDDPQKEIPAANFAKIRLFQVKKAPAGEPQSDVPIDFGWVACSPQTVGRFSGVAYFFGRELHQKLEVPIGLIHTSWGGTRIEPWTPPAGFKQQEATKYITDILAKADQNYRNYVQANLPRLEAWIAETKKAIAEDKPISPMPGGMPKHQLENSGAPTGLYNGMVHGLVPFAIRGAIWYQGESNRGQGMHYRDLMQALIGGWREVWNQEANRDFPFLFVQLAPYNYGNSPAALPEIWEAQTAVLKTVTNTGMAVTTDIGNVKDIHPRNKQAVGKRLALWALAKTYGNDKLVFSGPLFKEMKVEDGKAVISFDHIGGGLAVRDSKLLTHFEIAGEDKVFVPAKAEIVGDTVIVTSGTVAKPAAVRYGWSHTAEPNLANLEGLPASPFRTDDWK